MARRLVSNLKEDYLSCSICLEQYKLPKTLPCDHIFCQACLINHVKGTITRNAPNVTIMCPICRHQITLTAKEGFDVDTWVKGLPTDSLVGSLMQTLRKHERDPKHSELLPKLCQQHGGKTRDAYCFRHAQLMCWECAAREHRLCNVDSADKAKHVVKPELESLKKTIENNLTRARELSKVDETFNISRANVLNDIQAFESRLDAMVTSAKHQIFHLKSEVENVTKLHQDERKNFYDVVSSLLEIHCSIEMMLNEQKASDLFSAFETVKKDSETVVTKFKAIENESEASPDRHVTFIPDKRVENFLAMYSGIGFIDSNIPGSTSMPHGTVTPRSAPESLSHILKKSKSTGAVKTVKQ